MNLHKGECVFCKSSTVVYIKNLQDVWTAIFSIFRKFVRNEPEFKNLREQLELCPTCVYVVSLMGNHFKLIDHSNKIKSSNRCLLCDTSSAKDYKVREDLKGIISDIEPYKNVSKLRSFRLCGGCFHFIHYSKIYSRNLLKKYPSLSKIIAKTPPKATESTKLQSKSGKSSGKVFKATPKRNNATLSRTLKFLKTVRQSSNRGLFTVNYNVKNDPKLYNSLPYVKLNRISDAQKYNKIDDFQSSKRSSRTSKNDSSSDSSVDSSATRTYYSDRLRRVSKPTFKIKLKKEHAKPSPAVKKVAKAAKKKRKSQSEWLKQGKTLQINIVRGTPIKTKAAVKSIEPLTKNSPRKSVTFADEKNVEFDANDLSSDRLGVNESNSEKSPASKSILKNPTRNSSKKRNKILYYSHDSSDDEFISPRTLRKRQKTDDRVISISSSSSDSDDTEKVKKVNGQKVSEAGTEKELNDVEDLESIEDTVEDILDKINDTLETNDETNEEESQESTSNKNSDNIVEIPETSAVQAIDSDNSSDNEEILLNKSTPEELFDKLKESSGFTPVKKYKPRPRSKQKNRDKEESKSEENAESSEEKKSDEAEISKNVVESDEQENKEKDLITEKAELSDDVEDEFHLKMASEDSSEEAIASEQDNNKASEGERVDKSLPSNGNDNNEITESNNPTSDDATKEASIENNVETVEDQEKETSNDHLESDLHKDDDSNALNSPSNGNDAASSFVEASFSSISEKSSKSNSGSPKKSKPSPLKKKKKHETSENNEKSTDTDISLVQDVEQTATTDAPKKKKACPLSKKKKYEADEKKDTSIGNSEIVSVDEGNEQASDTNSILPSITEGAAEENESELRNKNSMVIPEELVQSLVSKFVAPEQESESCKSVNTNERTAEKVDESFVTQTMTDLYADL